MPNVVYLSDMENLIKLLHDCRLGGAVIEEKYIGQLLYEIEAWKLKIQSAIKVYN